MKIKTPTEFLTFSDGFADIYTVASNKPVSPARLHLAFGNRTVGMKRYWEARSDTAEITRLVQVPLQEDITTHDQVVIAGMRYKILQAQQLYNTNPRVTVLALQNVGVMAT